MMQYGDGISLKRGLKMLAILLSGLSPWLPVPGTLTRLALLSG